MPLLRFAQVIDDDVARLDPGSADRHLEIGENRCPEGCIRLGALDERQVEIVELRYFAGLEVEEVAELLALSPTTIKRESAMARAFLVTQLGS